MLPVVTSGAYYPPVVTTWKILTTGASYLTTGTLCTGEVTGLLFIVYLRGLFNTDYSNMMRKALLGFVHIFPSLIFSCLTLFV